MRGIFLSQRKRVVSYLGNSSLWMTRDQFNLQVLRERHIKLTMKEDSVEFCVWQQLTQAHSMLISIPSLEWPPILGFPWENTPQEAFGWKIKYSRGVPKAWWKANRKKRMQLSRSRVGSIEWHWAQDLPRMATMVKHSHNGCNFLGEWMRSLGRGGEDPREVCRSCVHIIVPLISIMSRFERECLFGARAMRIIAKSSAKALFLPQVKPSTSCCTSNTANYPGDIITAKLV